MHPGRLRHSFQAIAHICSRLDGIPLALAMAASWVNALTVQEIAQRLSGALDARFKLLANASRSVSRRQQTLWTAMEWSYNLLSGLEQCLLRRLTVFTGSWTAEAAEAVCSDKEVDRGSMLGLLAALVNKSLVKAITTEGSEARYTLLETIRQYAREKVMASGEMPALRDSHLQYYLELTKDTLPKLNGPYQKLWLNGLESEYGSGPWRAHRLPNASTSPDSPARPRRRPGRPG